MASPQPQLASPQHSVPLHHATYPNAGLRWWHLAALDGDAAAQKCLGVAYMHGEGCSGSVVDEKQGMEWFERVREWVARQQLACLVDCKLYKMYLRLRARAHEPHWADIALFPFSTLACNRSLAPRGRGGRVRRREVRGGVRRSPALGIRAERVPGRASSTGKFAPATID